MTQFNAEIMSGEEGNDSRFNADMRSAEGGNDSRFNADLRSAKERNDSRFNADNRYRYVGIYRNQIFLCRLWNSSKTVGTDRGTV